MKHSILKTALEGYENYDTIKIDYYFPSGIQGKEHPNQGKQYSGISRIAYLPNTTDGKSILKLLYRAFELGLTFTISVSRTTNVEGITWNDIHHKTQMNGT